MFPDVAKDAGSILHFKRQSDSPVNANRPRSLVRFYFLKFPTRRKSVATQEITERKVNRCPILFTELFVGFFEAR